MILETERLILREFALSDAQGLFDLNSDPLVVRYTGDGPFESVQAVEKFIAAYDTYRKYGFGRWSVIRKSDGAYLGWCGLKYIPDYDEFDVGYRFFQRYWGMGYATEAAKPCLGLGFDRFGMPEIVGRAMTANAGSIRVLEKIGMRYHRDFEFNGAPGVVYVMTKAMYTGG